MKRRLNRDDVEAAIVGGLLLSAGGSGGSGLVRNRTIGEMALFYSGVDLVDPDDLGDDALAMIATGVGAPATSKPRTEPRHAIESARLLLRESNRPVCAVMPAHVPGLYAWLVASVLGIDLLDAATNGRGHPTVRLGSMGFANDSSAEILQAGVGGHRGSASQSILARGSFAATSEIIRTAASANGGLILASRGPVSIGHIRKFGAPRALSFQIDLGQAMLSAPAGDHAEAAARFLGGTVASRGRVSGNSVVFEGKFDVGLIEIDDGRNPIRLGVCNEYMTAERLGERLCTFPDLIATIDPVSGLGLETSELVCGREVAVITADRRQLPLGAGVLDPVAYEEIEQAMGADIVKYALGDEHLTSRK